MLMRTFSSRAISSSIALLSASRTVRDLLPEAAGAAALLDQRAKGAAGCSETRERNKAPQRDAEAER